MAAADALEGAERVRRIVLHLHALTRPSQGLGPVDIRRILDLAVASASSEIAPKRIDDPGAAGLLPVEHPGSRQPATSVRPAGEERPKRDGKQADPGWSREDSTWHP